MTDSSTSSFNDTANAEPTKPVRVTFAVLLVAIFWAFYATVGILDLGNFPSFLMRSAPLPCCCCYFSSGG